MEVWLTRHVLVFDRRGVLEVRPGGIRLDLDPEALTVDGRPLGLGGLLRCFLRIGGRCLKLDEPPIPVPRLLHSVRLPWGLAALRLGEIQLAAEAALGNGLARDLAELVTGSPRLTRLYRRRASLATRFARDPVAGVRYRASGLEALLLGQAPASAARSFVWGGEIGATRLAVAARYGYYSPLLGRVSVGPREAWMLVLAVYAAFNVFAEPGAVTVNGDAVEAVPYAVLRVLGRWVGVARVVGGCAVVASVNVATQCSRLVPGGRVEVLGDALLVGPAGLNACPRAQRLVARTPDLELVGEAEAVCGELARMRRAGSWFVAWAAR